MSAAVVYASHRVEGISARSRPHHLISLIFYACCLTTDTYRHILSSVKQKSLSPKGNILMATNNSASGKPGLVRQLGLFDSTMIMMGIVIGSGIFLTTGIMAESIPSAGLILLAWIVGGLLTLAGALTYAELGAAMPEAGGQYVYLKKAYGPLPGFLFGWLSFTVYMAGGIAALAVAFAEYYGYFFPALSTKQIIYSANLVFFNYTYEYSLSVGQFVAVAAIILLSLFNYVGVGLGKGIQNFLTVIKIGILAVFIILGFTIGQGSTVDITHIPPEMSFAQIFIGFGVALIAVSWAFDGWNNINFVAGEIRNPKRNLPAVLILGTLCITVLYVLINYIYLWSLPVDQIVGVETIAEKSAAALFGGPAPAIISAAVIVSVIGALNGSILVGPRIYYAMAKDKLFFKGVAKVNTKYRTPGFAIALQAVWSSALALSGTFNQILTFAMFINIAFWIAATASVFTLRKKFPEMPRPYKTWGYPVVPILFIITSAGILINTLIDKPIESLAGIMLTAIGIPVYYLWKRRIQGT